MRVGTIAEGDALVANTGSSLEALLRVGRRVHLAEVVGDGLVVALGSLERLEGETTAGSSRDLTVRLPLGNDGVIVCRRADNRCPLVVLGSSTEESYTSDVDLLNRTCKSAVRLGGLHNKGVEVADDKGDLVDTVVGKVSLVGLDRTCEDTTVDSGVEGLYATAEHLGGVGDRRDIPSVSLIVFAELTQSRGHSRG